MEDNWQQNKDLNCKKFLITWLASKRRKQTLLVKERWKKLFLFWRCYLSLESSQAAPKILNMKGFLMKTNRSRKSLINQFHLIKSIDLSLWLKFSVMENKGTVGRNSGTAIQTLYFRGIKELDKIRRSKVTANAAEIIEGADLAIAGKVVQVAINRIREKTNDLESNIFKFLLIWIITHKYWIKWGFYC